jgi:hypothetical protein
MVVSTYDLAHSFIRITAAILVLKLCSGAAAIYT